MTDRMTEPKVLLLAGLLFAGAAEPVAAQHGGHGEAPMSSPPAVVEPATVEVPSEKRRLIGLTTAVVAPRALKRSIRTVGRVEYDERRQAVVTTKFEGWIEKLPVDYTGRRVVKGEALAEIYSPDLFATQQEFLNLLAWKTRDRAQRDDEMGKMLAQDNEALVEAARQRLRLMDVGEEQIREIEGSGKAFRTLTLTSPVTGTVTQKAAVLGMRVMPGERLFEIVDLSSVWVLADIYEQEIPLVREGDVAKITFSNRSGTTIAARVEYVSAALSGEARTVKVRFSVPNADHMLKPQMFTNIEMDVDLGRRLAVPDDAVIDTGQRQIVYVDKGDDAFEPREVKLGLRAEGYREVLSGLKAGEKVARSATFLIDSEAQLKGVR